MTKEKPLYKHDCTTCVFLGIWRNTDDPFKTIAKDLYLCFSAQSATVIARSGNEPPNYTSGNCAGFFQMNPALAKAAELAINFLSAKAATAAEELKSVMVELIEIDALVRHSQRKALEAIHLLKTENAELRETLKRRDYLIEKLSVPVEDRR